MRCGWELVAKKRSCTRRRNCVHYQFIDTPQTTEAQPTPAPLYARPGGCLDLISMTYVGAEFSFFGQRNLLKA